MLFALLFYCHVISSVYLCIKYKVSKPVRTPRIASITPIVLGLSEVDTLRFIASITHPVHQHTPLTLDTSSTVNIKLHMSSHPLGLNCLIFGTPRL